MQQILFTASIHKFTGTDFSQGMILSATGKKFSPAFSDKYSGIACYSFTKR